MKSREIKRICTVSSKWQYAYTSKFYALIILVLSEGSQCRQRIVVAYFYDSFVFKSYPNVIFLYEYLNKTKFIVQKKKNQI